MTSTTTAQSTSKDNASAALIEATIVIRIVSPVQAEEPIRSRAASTRSAHWDQRVFQEDQHRQAAYPGDLPEI